MRLAASGHGIRYAPVVPEVGPPPAARRARGALAVLTRLAVAALVFAYLATRIDLADMRSALAAVRSGSVLAAFTVSMIVNVILAHRLRLLMEAQGIRMPTREAFEINQATAFYGLVLPGGSLTGIAVRFYRLARASGRYTAGLLAIVCDRLATVAAISATGLTCWGLDPHDKPGSALAVLALAAAVVSAVIVPLAAPRPMRRLAAVLGAGGLASLHAWLRRAGRALAVIAHLRARTLHGVLLLSLLAQLAGMATFTLLAWALGLAVPVVALGWVRSVALLVTAIPISVGGLGIREGTLVLLLGPYGVESHDALAFSLLVFAVTIVGSGLVGGALEAVRWLGPVAGPRATAGGEEPRVSRSRGARRGAGPSSRGAHPTPP